MVEETREKTDDNVVFIGTKPFMTYVTSVVLQFSAHNREEVVIKARGKFIAKAVDVAEVVKKRFLDKQKVEIKDIKTDSEDFENKQGRKVNVSAIEITLAKK
jgi:archaea-specific DNA-binding protein